MDDQDPLDALKKLKAQQVAPDPLEQLKALRPARPVRPVSKPSDLNNQPTANELAAAGGDDEQPGIAGSLADIAGGTFPGAPAALAGVRSLIRRQPYAEAYGDIKRQTDKIPTSAKVIGRMSAGVPLMSLLPGSAAVSGALIGGADQALDADPERGLGSRALGTATGAAAGAATGKILEMIPTAARVLKSKASDVLLSGAKKARAASGDALFSKAIAEGQGMTNTPGINQQLAMPDNADLILSASELRQHQGQDPNSPEMLDALYKARSDRAAALKRGLDSSIPNRPNIGRATQTDNRLAQQDLLDVMSGGTTMPGPMPTYREAVTDYAKRSADIGGIRKGQDALKAGISKFVPSGKNIDRAVTPQNLSDWAANQSPSVLENASAGILGAAKGTAAKHPIKGAYPALSDVPSLLRLVKDPRQQAIDALVKAGLLGGNALVSP